MNQKKIKILFAISTMSIGGAPSVVFDQCRMIDKKKFDPYVITLYNSKKANFFNELYEFLDKKKVIEFRLKNRSLFDFKTWYGIYRFLNKNNFDVVYTHLFLPNTIVRILAILTGVKIILSFEHSMYFNKSKWQIKVDKFLSYFTDYRLILE